MNFESSGSPRVLEGCRVLLVEDDSDTRQMMKFVLEKSGASVTAAESVPSALERFRSNKPDVIVADIAMPGLNGYALIAEVRNSDNDFEGQTPAIAVTAYSTPQDQARAIAAGFQSYLTKPFDPNELIQAVEQLRS